MLRRLFARLRPKRLAAAPRYRGEAKIAISHVRHSYDKVVAATRDLRVRYPVVQDNEHAIWRRWGTRAWPTLVLVDKRGVVRYRHIGEGAYDETEAMIQRLLAEGS